MGFERWCVIKLLKEEFLHQDSPRRALGTEARVLARLDHAHVVKLLDFDEHADSGHLFLAMPYIQGRSVSTLVQRGMGTPYFAVAEALWVGAALMRALGHVHTRRDPITAAPLHIVHRDVSPENVMIGYNGDIQLIDFGIALTQLVSRDTKAHRIKGKAQYMSPEQARGETDLDLRSDVFAAGLVLYFMLTGREPLGADPIEAMRRARQPNFPMPHQVTDVPREISELVAHMLAAERAARPHDARAIAHRLTALLQKFYPGYSAHTFAQQTSRILARERQQDSDMLASLSAGTQIIADPGPDTTKSSKPTPPTIELDPDEHDAHPSSRVTVPDMAALDSDGASGEHGMDNLMQQIDDLYE